MKKCKYCGKEFESTPVYCIHCGASNNFLIKKTDEVINKYSEKNNIENYYEPIKKFSGDKDKYIKNDKWAIPRDELNQIKKALDNEYYSFIKKKLGNKPVNSRIKDEYYSDLKDILEDPLRSIEETTFNGIFDKEDTIENTFFKSKEKRLDYLLKYPIYLQLCGKEYSGWMEFFSIKKLLFSYEKDNEITLSELLFYESKISNVMSIFQERKKEYASTIFYTLRSYIETLLSLHHNIIQQKKQESLTADENLKKSFHDLSIQGKHYLKLKQASFQIVSMLATPLHRIGYLPLLESYFELTKETLKDIPNIDYLTLEEQVQEIFNNYKRKIMDKVF